VLRRGENFYMSKSPRSAWLTDEGKRPVSGLARCLFLRGFPGIGADPRNQCRTQRRVYRVPARNL
jgi:hypothetical protein